MPPRTIDNLGVEVSTRYAEDQKTLDASLIKEARGVGRQAEIDVTIPYNPSELEILMETGYRNVPWARFYPPPYYAEQKKRLYTFLIAPSIGPEDKLESQTERLKAFSFPMAAPKEELAHPKEENEQQREKRRKWELEKEVEEEQREKKIILVLLERIAHLDKYLVDINSRRGQYHRG